MIDFFDPGSFANRRKEIEAFEREIEELDHRVVFVDAQPQSGSSYFLKYLFHTKSSKSCACVYLQLSRKIGHLSEAMSAADVRELNSEESIAVSQRKMKGVIDTPVSVRNFFPALGTSLVKAAVAIFEISTDMSAVGTLLAGIASEGFFRGCFEFMHGFQSNRALLDETDPELFLVKKIFSSYEGECILIIIDGAEHLEERCYEEIRNYLFYVPTVRIVLGFTSKDNDGLITKAKSILSSGDSSSPDVASQIPIPIDPPDLDMFGEMARKRGCGDSGKDPGDWRDLWSSCGNDAYRMDVALKSMAHAAPPSALQRHLAQVMRAAALPIPVAGLVEICDASTAYAREDIAEEIDRLRRQSWLIVDPESRAYAVRDAPFDASCEEELAAASALLEYGMGHLSNLSFAWLGRLVDLARDVYPNNLSPVRELLRRFGMESIFRGRNGLDDESLAIAFPGNSCQEILYRTMAYFLSNDFDRAYSFLKDKEGLLQGSESLMLLWGITLNRVRKQKEAEAVLSQVCRSGSTVDVRTIAASYLLVNHIYLGNVDKAIGIYESRGSFRRSRYYPYLVRNAASALVHNDEVVSELEGLLESDTLDDFCAATITCNLGRAYMGREDYEKAERLLVESERMMASYRFRNQAVVKNNLALISLARGNAEKAESQIRQAAALSVGEAPYHRMQVLTIGVNRAVIAFGRDAREAMRLLDEIEEQVMQYPVTTIKGIYWSTRALLETLCGLETAGLCIERMLEYPDPLNEDRYLSIAEALDRYAKSADRVAPEELWRQAYIPACLVFWYVSPMETLDGLMR